MPPAALPVYFVWIDSIVYVKYAYMGLMLNEFRDRDGTFSVLFNPRLSFAYDVLKQWRAQLSQIV